MRVLIVDDSRFIRDYLRDMFEGQGIDCSVAEDGREALDRLKTARPFEVALVDWNMPGMGGLELVRTVRSLSAFDSMKILMVTTEGANNAIQAALDAGADEYLMKPFDDACLKEKLAMIGVFPRP